jgi:hypothetical protein
MRHHNMWAPALGPGAVESGVIGSVGVGLCRMLHMEFGD